MIAMQCRAARGLLKWTQLDLARHSGVSGVTVRGFENERTSPNPATLTVMRLALEKAGVEFIADVGVKLNSSKARRAKK